MTKLACRYAIIQFMPYLETGEFANVGVVLACPKAGYFSYRLEKRKYGRITNFFEEMDRSLYRKAVINFESELARVEFELTSLTAPTEVMRGAFEHLVRPREAIVRFGEPRAILTQSPEDCLAELFDHYVGRKFATKDYQETILARRVAGIVNSLELELPFREEKIGNDDYPVHFPLVQKQANGKVIKLIKPLFLGHDEPNKIYTHGDAWLSKISRLKKLSALPEKVLFAINMPEPTYLRRSQAAASIGHDLKELGVVVVHDNDQERIRDFALARLDS